MVEAIRFKDKDAAKSEVMRLIQLRADGGPNQFDEALAIVREWGLDEEWTRKAFRGADEAAKTWKGASLKNPVAQPSVA